MDTCAVDITVEFLAVAFHNILYYATVYPKSIFETRKKYGVVVYYSTHPEVNQYIDLCLKSIAECLKNGQLYRIEFSITNHDYEPVVNFIFDLDKSGQFDETSDAYLIQVEQNLRAFCLNLSAISHKVTNVPEDCSFVINLHSNESTAVAIATNPALEDFPMVEVEVKHCEVDRILPLRRFCVRNFSLDIYIELK